MSLKNIFISSSLAFLLCGTAYAEQKNTNFNNTNKASNEWKYFLNNKDISYFPDLELDGSIKYLPVDIVRSIGAILSIDYQNKTAYVTTNDESFVLKDKVKEIYPNNTSYKLQDAPIWKNNTIYVPSNFLIKLNILVSENKYQNELNIIKTFNNISEIKSNIDSVESKIILSLDSLPIYETTSNRDSYKVTLLGTGIKEFDKIKKQLEGIGSNFKKIEIDNSKQGIINLIFFPKTNFDNANVYYLDKPAKLVIQFPKIYKSEIKEFVRQGLNVSKISESNYQGPIKINILEINPKSQITLRPLVYREGNNFNLKEVSKFSKDYNAIAGVNGGYFSLNTRFPLGFVMINNNLLSTPIYNRTSLFFNKDGSFDIKTIDLNIFIKSTDNQGLTKQLKVNAYNQIPQKNQIVMFTYNYGKDRLNKKKLGTTAKNDKDIPVDEEKEYSGYLISKNGQQFEKLENFNSEVPAGKYVLYASGKGKEDLDKLYNNIVNYELLFNYSDNIDNAIHALGGGPRLIKDSQVFVSSLEEKFKPDIAEGRAPRTALALLKNGKIIIATVDGRQEASRGMSLDELAYFFKSYEAKDAINFDGGGSTAMYLNGGLINTVSDPQERKVSTVLFLFQK